MIDVTCDTCGKTFKKFLNDIKKTAHNFCSRKCFYASPQRSPNTGRKGNLSFGWRGGVLYERGYKLVIAPKDHPFAIRKGGGVGYIREHRLIMEKQIGRYLRPEEVVHHINGDVNDNRLENLLLMEWGQHTKLHREKHWAKYHKKHPVVVNKCPDCHKVISKNATRCMSCSKKGILNPNCTEMVNARKWAK